MTTLCVHGHRPDKLGGWAQPNQVSQYIYDELKMILSGNRPSITQRPSLVLIGGDLGVPQWAGKACRELNIPYEVIIPFGDFSSKWPPHSKLVYSDLCTNASRVHNVSGKKEYSSGEIYKRNKYLSLMADKVLVFWDGSSGVTSNLATYTPQSKLVKVSLPPNLAQAASDAYAMEQVKKLKKSLPQPAYYQPPSEILPGAEEKAKNLVAAFLGISPKPTPVSWAPQKPEDNAAPDGEEDATLSQRLAPKRVVEID